ncbi:hypothetical protein ACIQ7S_14450 [Streptomyces griseoluteus]|uniref:hypothetical protein n=1 Tax=Streptomyces griseoluteus TaxID=29306 RepID=UPI00332ADB62
MTFTKTADAVSMAGPDEMAEVVQSLREAIWRMDRAGTAWYQCVRSGDTAGSALREREFRVAEAARTRQGFLFLAAARRALRTEH